MGMFEYVDIHKGYILAPGITMPSYDIYEIDIFGGVEAFRRGVPILHSAESTLEAEQWIDKQPMGVVTKADMAQFDRKGLNDMPHAAGLNNPTCEGLPVGNFWGDYKTNRQMVERFLEKSSGYITDPAYVLMVGQQREQERCALRDLLNGTTDLIAAATVGMFAVGAVRPGSPFFLFKKGWPEPVPSGTWMGWPEPEWGLSEREWEQLPLEEQARMEAVEQTKFVREEYYREWLNTYAPSAADEIWWDRGGHKVGKTALATVYEAEAKLQRASL